MLPLELYIAIIDHCAQLTDNDLLKVFSPQVLRLPEIAEQFSDKVLGSRNLNMPESSILMLAQVSRPIVIKQIGLPNLLQLIRKQYKNRADYVGALATDYCEVFSEIRRQDMPFNPSHLVSECMIPPYTFQHLGLLSELWLGWPFEMQGQDILKLFNREIQRQTTAGMIQITGYMFTILSSLAIKRHEMAPVLYRNLVMIYVQSCDSLLKESMVGNFLSFFKESNAPVAILLDPYLKQLQSSIGFEQLCFVWKLLEMGQDRLGWKSVQLCLSRVLTSMLHPECIC